MFNKLYEKVKQFIRNNYEVFILVILLYVFAIYQFPYTISKPGGIIDTKNKVEISSELEMEGSLNMAYVSQVPPNALFLLLSVINKDWDSEIRSNEVFTRAEENEFNHLMLEEANNDAYVCALDASNIKYTKVDNKVYIMYVEKAADTTLEIGDQIIAINDIKIHDKEQLYNITSKYKEGDELTFDVIHDDKTYKRKATLKLFDGKPKVGVILYESYKINSDRNIEFNFKKSESGGSGGLMMSLTIYSYLNNIDLTKGKKIVGTGTIDAEGNVGEISGVKYKVLGAINEGADVFLVPKGDNYKEARRLKNERKLDIEIVSVETFEDALNYLEKM